MSRHRVGSVGCVLVSLLLLVSATPAAYAQWLHCGPWGGSVSSFAAAGNRLLASTIGNPYLGNPGSGVFLSLDSGRSWSQSNSGLTDTTVLALGTSGKYVLASSATGALFRSSDSGASWQRLPSLTVSKPITSFLSLGNYLFAVTGADGVLRSTDHGMTWLRITVDTTVTDIHSLASIDTLLFANGSWSSNGGIYRSTNYGKTWSEVYDNAFDIAAIGSRIVAAMYHTVSLAMDLSTDYGATWTECGSGGCGVYDEVIGAGRFVVARHSQNGIFISQDSGATWSGTPLWDVGCAIAVGPALLIGNSSGVVRSIDGGKSWDTTSAGIYLFEPTLTTRPSGFAAVGHTLVTGGLRSTNGGLDWAVDTFSVLPYASYATEGNTLFASDRSGLYRSDDGAVTWRSVNGSDFWPPVFVAGSTLFALVNDNTMKLMRSTNAGKSWTDVGESLHPGPYGFDELTLAFDGHAIYAATPYTLFRSSDLGDSWKDISGAMLDGVTALTVSGENICVAAGTRVYRSKDGGQSWMAKEVGFQVNNFLQSGNSILAATTRGVYLSKDDGATWALTTAGMTPDTNAAYAFAVVDSMVYVSTDNGIWRQQRSEIPFRAQPAGVDPKPEDAGIQIGPNPTSGPISISGATDAVSVIDLLGSPLLTSRTASTDRTIDLSFLPAGIYFVRVTTPEGVLMRRIVKE